MSLHHRRSEAPYNQPFVAGQTKKNWWKTRKLQGNPEVLLAIFLKFGCKIVQSKQFEPYNLFLDNLSLGD